MTRTNGLVQQFGQGIRHFRKRQSWSQERLAEEADINRSYLGEIERGQKSPSLETAAKLAVALDLSLSGLLAFCEQLPERGEIPVSECVSKTKASV